MTQLVESDYSERIKIESWRLHVLIEAGYPLPLAEKIAHSNVDLHQAVDLAPRRLHAGARHRNPPLTPLLTP